ncbi:ATP-binding protein [Nocardia sp. 004]|uniref:ATP-binding protein n=1 Tax=Nocardia sp. 004 TaxID=3385978 RepID=UPI0039A3152C
MEDVERGQLRIYLGAAPGAGRTHAMLNEAHRWLQLGRDVVAAVTGTHDDMETARLLEGIERIPPKLIEYHGTTSAELDLEAVLRRAPAMVLVEELAHANLPGGKNDKRWQDVDDLLDAGIDVLSTLELQQLEGLSDVVTQLTGRPHCETVPDAVVRAANRVELVDITPEILRRTFSHRSMSTAEKTAAALHDYSQWKEPAALRELSLLWLAGQIDAALAKYRTDHPSTEPREVPERVMAAVTGGPGSETIVRRAGRIASRSSAELAIVHVVRSADLAGVSAERLTWLRELAEELGASLHTITSDDVPTALLEFAHETNVTQLVLGAPQRSRWSGLFTEGTSATVLRLSGEIDVHIVTHEYAQRATRRLAPGARRRTIAWLAAVLLPPTVFAISATVLDNLMGLAAISALFVVGVVAVALLGRIVPALFAALLSGLLMRFITPPRYSLAVTELTEWITLIVLLAVGVAIVQLVDLAAKQTRQARQASRQAELLTMFSGAILHGADLPKLLEQLREVFAQRAVSLVAGELVLAEVGADPPRLPSEASTVVEASDAHHQLLLAGGPLAAADRPVLNAVANQSVALVRQTRLAEEASAAAALQEANRLRQALLSAVSHDLRTPLAGAKAAVSSLCSDDDDIEFSQEDIAELLETIEESVDQLTALVDNLLDSSRLAVGVVTPQVQRVYAEEAVHRAMVSVGMGARGQRRAVTARVRVDVGDIVVQADSGLLERVLANLLDNALRHTPDGSPILVTAACTGDRTTISVVDSGPGVPQGMEERLFEPFQRLGDRDNTSGVGLGLSVVHGFVQAMGGTVRAEPTAGGGLTMVVDLPSAEVPALDTETAAETMNAGERAAPAKAGSGDFGGGTPRRR